MVPRRKRPDSPPVRRSPARRRIPAAVAAAMLACAGASSAPAAPNQALEYEAKAVFLYKVTRFIDWPDSTGTPLRIGVLGDDPFGDSLPAVFPERGGQPTACVTRISSLAHLDGFDVLFVARSEAARVCEILEKLRGRPVLTVSDLDDFCERGGMIGLDMEDHRLRLRTNPAASDRAHLRIHASLLRLAEQTREEGCD